MKVCIGGTFDKVHPGHRLLVKTAKSVTGNILVGLTTDSYAKRRKRRKVAPFEQRKRALRRLLPRAKVVPISDPYGPAITDRSITSIVVSTETYKTALAINRKRKKKGMKELTIVVIPIVKGRRGRKISARRSR